MKLLDKHQETRQVTTGRLSDGSDRLTLELVQWVATVLTDEGQAAALAFNHDPTDQELVLAAPARRVVVGTNRAGLRGARDAAWAEWQQAKSARDEVIRRAVPGDQAWATGPNGLGFQWVEASWAAYRASVIAWAAAL